MKLAPTLWLISSLAAVAATEEQLNQRFTVHPEGQLIVEVDFGSIAVTTHGADEVVVDVWRKITRRNKADEEKFLQDHPVTFSQDGNTVTVRSRRKGTGGWSSSGRSRTEAKYTLSDLPVMVAGEVARGRLKGTVNGGGKSVVLRSSAGSIRLKKP